ncbi:IS21 family transposase, partial [Sphingomonas sp. HH69]
PRCRSPHLPDSAERLQGGRLLRRPQQDYPAATVVEYCSAVLKQRSREMFVPLAHPAGDAQADFGEALVEIGGVEQKAYFFALDLT